MQFGVVLPISGAIVGVDAITRVARESERLGFDSLWVRDSLTRNVEEVKSHPSLGSVRAWDNVEGPIIPHHFEALSTLLYVAGLTENMGVGTAVLMLPMRHPMWLAKMLACLDQFTGGRVKLGIGIGSAHTVKGSLEAIGEPEIFGRRGAITEEWVAIMRSAWKNPVVNFEGKFLTIRGAEVYPHPVRETIPLYYGGDAVPRVMDRLARLFDGWMPLNRSPQDIQKGRHMIDELAEGYGRSPSEFKITSQHFFAINAKREAARERAFEAARVQTTYNIQHADPRVLNDPERIARHERRLAEDKGDRVLAGNADDITAMIKAYEEAGVDELVLRVTADDLEDLVDQLAQFKEEVRDRL